MENKEDNSWEIWADAIKNYIIDTTNNEIKYKLSDINRIHNTIYQLRKENDEIRKDIFNIKYPNGLLEIRNLSLYYKYGFNYVDDVFLIKLDESNEYCYKDIKKLESNKYFVNFNNELYFVVDIKEKLSIRVDKDMRVVL